MATASRTDSTSGEIAIFGRLIQAEKGNLAPELARYVLTLGFGKDEQARIDDLVERNRSGLLKRSERKELLDYVRASHLLAMLHSKARKSLKRRRAS